MPVGIKTYPIPVCPDCGAQMELKRPKSHQDWKPFWGCSQFKFGCRGTRNIDPETGEPEEVYWDEYPSSDWIER